MLIYLFCDEPADGVEVSLTSAGNGKLKSIKAGWGAMLTSFFASDIVDI